MEKQVFPHLPFEESGRPLLNHGSRSRRGKGKGREAILPNLGSEPDNDERMYVYELL